MKANCVLLFFIFFATITLAQLPKNPETGKIEYSEVLEIQEPQKDLYLKLRDWAMAYYSYIIEDKENHMIIVRGKILTNSVMGTLAGSQGQVVYFLLKLEAKHGKYRYSFLNFNVEDPGAGLQYSLEDRPILTKGLMNRINISIVELIRDLKYHMALPSKYDW